MVQELRCPRCSYCTEQRGHYNRHLNKPRGCRRKQSEQCDHCQKTFTVDGSGLRKHTCAANDLLPFNMRIASDCTHSVTLALQQLQTLSRYRLKQLGFVDSNPVNVAVAAIRYVHLNADIAQSQNITGCQHSTSKFDIVQQCCGTLIWVSWLKSDIIPVLLDEAADVIEGLAESVPAKLPKTQAEVLDHFVNHVLRPSWKSSQPEGYENLYRKGRPDLLGKREDVCFAVNALDFR